MSDDVCLTRERLKLLERVLHFTGVSFYEEVTPQERAEFAEKQLSWILNNTETRQAFQEYNPTSVTLTLTFSTRLSGLATAISNYIAGNNLYARLPLELPQLIGSRFYQHDPVFGEDIDSLIGRPQKEPLFLKGDLKKKDAIRIADFACAPKKGGSGDLLFLKDVLGTLFPDKKFEFFGYDVDFRERYPVFTETGEFVGWDSGYIFEGEGIVTLKGDTYYNANNPAFNIVPQRKNSSYVNTFDISHNRYDIIINSMFYSLFEMNIEPRESLDIILQNQLALRSPGGVLFLNTCDDCFKIFPFPQATALPQVIPFISSLENIRQKINEILIGGKYCNGVYDLPYSPAPEEREEVEKAIYIAHRLATRDVTFLDRLFETYERIDEGANLQAALSCLTDLNLSIAPERRAGVRMRVYSIKRSIT